MTPEELAMFQYLQRKQQQNLEAQMPTRFNFVPIVRHKKKPEPPKPVIRKKKRVVRKSDTHLGFWVLCFVVFLITVRFLYNEFQEQPEPKVIKKVVYQKKPHN